MFKDGESVRKGGTTVAINPKCPECGIDRRKKEYTDGCSKCQKRKASDERMKYYFQARQAIIASGLKRGIIECPLCQGRLGFSIASNHHVSALCDTTGCLAWIE